jgi:hypothetical protein
MTDAVSDKYTKIDETSIKHVNGERLSWLLALS